MSSYKWRRRKRTFALVIKVLFFIIVGSIVGAGTSTIGGRIILPEMGLEAPRFGTWYAVFFVYLIGYAIIKAIGIILDMDED